MAQNNAVLQEKIAQVHAALREEIAQNNAVLLEKIAESHAALRAEIAQVKADLDRKFTILFVVLFLTVVFLNQNALEFLARVLGFIQ